MVQEAWQALLSHITEPISINDNFFSVCGGRLVQILTLADTIPL